MHYKALASKFLATMEVKQKNQILIFDKRAKINFKTFIYLASLFSMFEYRYIIYFIIFIEFLWARYVFWMFLTNVNLSFYSCFRESMHCVLKFLSSCTIQEFIYHSTLVCSCRREILILVLYLTRIQYGHQYEELETWVRNSEQSRDFAINIFIHVAVLINNFYIVLQIFYCQNGQYF